MLPPESLHDGICTGCWMGRGGRCQVLERAQLVGILLGQARLLPHRARHQRRQDGGERLLVCRTRLRNGAGESEAVFNLSRSPRVNRTILTALFYYTHAGALVHHTAMSILRSNHDKLRFDQWLYKFNIMGISPSIFLTSFILCLA